VATIFDADAEPYVGKAGYPPQVTVEELAHTMMTLCEHLEGMPVCSLHSAADLGDIVFRNPVVE
jgi:hypothetical protein